MGGTPRQDTRSLAFAIEGMPGVVTVTTRLAGDLRPAIPDAAARQQEIVPGKSWSWTRQVHSSTVLSARSSGEAGDALVGTPSDRPAMFAADCALLGVLSPEGVVAAVHAGWPGLLAGVIEEAAAAMRAAGASQLSAVRGPCVGPECYEFGEDDLCRVEAVYGRAVRSTTADGRLALDLAEGVREACRRASITLVEEVASCTACATGPDGSPMWFSHRARKDKGRHALVVSEEQ